MRSMKDSARGKQDYASHVPGANPDAQRGEAAILRDLTYTVLLLYAVI